MSRCNEGNNHSPHLNQPLERRSSLIKLPLSKQIPHPLPRPVIMFMLKTLKTMTVVQTASVGVGQRVRDHLKQLKMALLGNTPELERLAVV